MLSGRQVHRLLLVTFLPVAASKAHAQTDNRPGSNTLPSGIVLLRGYSHEPLPTIDTESGRSCKAGGLSITYTIGDFNGNCAAGCPSDPLLPTEQHQNNRQPVVSLMELTI